jgi:hypothetical protein
MKYKILVSGREDSTRIIIISNGEIRVRNTGGGMDLKVATDICLLNQASRIGAARALFIMITSIYLHIHIWAFYRHFY